MKLCFNSCVNKISVTVLMKLWYNDCVKKKEIVTIKLWFLILNNGLFMNGFKKWTLFSRISKMTTIFSWPIHFHHELWGL